MLEKKKRLYSLADKHLSIDVGIWWIVADELVAFKKLLSADSYVLYDVMFTIDLLHINQWQHIVQHELLPTNLTESKDFGDYTRGRVLFNDKEQRHYVYSASWLVNSAEFQQKITTFYTLINPIFMANEQYEIDLPS